MSEPSGSAKADLLFPTVLTLIILCALVGFQLWDRFTLLHDGHEILLRIKQVETDGLGPGNELHLHYAINQITLPTDSPSNNALISGGFKKSAVLYVQLQPDATGLWSPRTLQRTPPTGTSGEVFIKGRITRNACMTPDINADKCVIPLWFGIETFTLPRRLRKFEQLQNQVAPKMTNLDHRLMQIQNSIRKIQNWIGNEDNRQVSTLKQKQTGLENHRDQTLALHQQNLARRLTVYIRLSRTSGEAAISGLRIDGRRLYKERLF